MTNNLETKLRENTQDVVKTLFLPGYMFVTWKKEKDKGYLRNHDLVFALEVEFVKGVAYFAAAIALYDKFS